jgi:parallel beta-helix repeat protein
MHVLQRTATILTFPVIAWLGAACQPGDAPTEAPTPGVSFDITNGQTHWVNDDDPNGPPYVPPGTSCNNPGYRTIQEAVTAASAGDHINVCPGLYPEQVVIPADKDDIRLRSTRQWEAVIKAPTLMVIDDDASGFTIVRVSGAQNVTILSFTITGPGPGPCGTLHFGVRVHHGGSANILGNHITDIRDNPFSGCQNGRAVQVGRVTTGSAQVFGNVIDNYQKNGVDVRDAGSSAEIAHNRIFGMGPTSMNAQNGIVVLGNATATIRHNFVANNIYTPPGTEATGILPFQSGQVVADHNTVTLNEVDIYMFQAAAGSTTTHNHVRASTDDGIVVDGSDGVRVAQNKIERNGGPGIGVYDAQANELDNNKVEENEDSGILLGDATSFAVNNTVGNNQVRENGTGGSDLTDGIRINLGSTGNTVHDNHLRDNVTHDCHDANAPAVNDWDGNHGETSLPPGLCGREEDDAAFETSTVYGWDPAYPWYDAFDVAAEFDWAATYATIDTESLLQLLPGIRVGDIRRAPASP